MHTNLYKEYNFLIKKENAMRNKKKHKGWKIYRAKTNNNNKSVMVILMSEKYSLRKETLIEIKRHIS